MILLTGEPIILFEDDDILVISKPPQVVVNRAVTVHEMTIQDWFLERLPTTSVTTSWSSLVPEQFTTEFGTANEIFAERGGIVHRLDKETSGVLILAKNPGSLVHLLWQFKQRQTQKMYTCLVHGKFHIVEDTVQLPLGRSPHQRTKFAVDIDGRGAETKYKVLQFYSRLSYEPNEEQLDQTRQLRHRLNENYQGFSLVECWPKTGRTHQLRVHLAFLKHPIVCDQTYLGRKRAALDAVWCPRLFLHASQLTFTHPRTGERQTVAAPLWPDLANTLKFFHE